MNNRDEKLAKFIQENPNAAKEILECSVNESPAAAAAKLNQYGFDFTVEEMEKITEQVLSSADALGEDGELNDDTLEKVSGGAIPVFIAGYWIVCAGAGALKALWDNWNKKRRK
ncbi:MAG: hypothetical protein IJI09_01740 [Clostridia bacterium]|nr:hypothetical protein [Clostridia bacterium]